MEVQKVCSVCGETKGVSAFRRHRTYCRKCQYHREHGQVTKWKRENRDKDCALMAKWRRAHPLSRKLSVIRRKGVLVKGLLELLETRYNNNPFCEYCGVALNYDIVSLDHKIPLVRGGSAGDPSNWALCCIDCNYLKNSRTSEEYVAFLKVFAKRVMDNTETSRNIGVSEGLTISPEITDTSTLTHLVNA